MRPPVSHPAVLAVLALALSAALSAAVGAGCANPAPAGFDPPDYECAKHEDCPGACVLGVCVRPEAALEPMVFSALDAAPWFVEADGACAYDTECGPWACADGLCAAQDTLGARVFVPPRAAFRYWDASCVDASDCRGWACVEGFCQRPGGWDPLGASVVAHVRPAGAAACNSDDRCVGPDADCVSPGYCVDGVASMPMAFAEVAPWTELTDRAGVCDQHADCGPWACSDGSCVPWEWVRDVPPRAAFFYFDGSCQSDDQCGPWRCDVAGTGLYAIGWCRP